MQLADWLHFTKRYKVQMAEVIGNSHAYIVKNIFLFFSVLMRSTEGFNIIKPDRNLLISPCVARNMWTRSTCFIVKVLPEVAHIIEAVLTSVWLTSLIRQRPLSIRALILLLCVGREGVLNAAAASAAVTHPLNAARPSFPVQLPAG